MKITQLISLLYLLGLLFSCRNTQKVNQKDVTSLKKELSDSLAYKKGLQHAVEEKLLPKYKK